MNDDLEEVTWEPYLKGRGHLRVKETSCCGIYEWACQGGQFLILRRRDGSSSYEETARGIYSHARALWERLLRTHYCEHSAVPEFPRNWRGRRMDYLP